MGKSLKEMPKRIWKWQVEMNDKAQKKVDKEGKLGMPWPG